jgi:hypothetical protein
MSGEQVADAFAKLAQVADKSEIDGCAVNLEYVRDDDKLIPGDLIPTITFSLERQRRVVDPAAIEVRPMGADAIEIPNPACEQ